jgi:hypothetical protein
VLAGFAIGALAYGLSIAMSITGARLVGAACDQVMLAPAPFIGALLAWPINGDHLTATTTVAFSVSLIGVSVVATSHHTHTHKHAPLHHAHQIDATDAHHQPGAIEVLLGIEHRHLALWHEHEHLPDIHHRHTHTDPTRWLPTGRTPCGSHAKPSENVTPIILI